MRSYFYFLILNYLVAGHLSSLPALEPIACLSAKSQFKPCAERSKLDNPDSEHRVDLSCLQADSGYSDCRNFKSNSEDHTDPGWHKTCLGAKSQYKQCRAIEGTTHSQCLFADSGFNDCMKAWEGEIWKEHASALAIASQMCLHVKSGYAECRKRNKYFLHGQCTLADSNYADCMDAGGTHRLCLTARRSFKKCYREGKLGGSLAYCVKVGKGYAECREKKPALGEACSLADQGFADCVDYKAE